MIRLFILLACTALLYGSCTSEHTQEEAPETKGPNFVFIYADDLGYGDLSAFGAEDISTPHIDRLAQEGIKFTSFYSPSPICSPARAGLLTGRMPQRMGINGVFFPESFTGMPASEITIAELLQQKDYRTGIVGKWHLGHLPQFLPLQQGFDEYYGIPYSNDMASVVYLKGNEVDSFQVDQRYTTQTYTRHAMDFIRKHAEQPFYLYLAHNMPHVPIYCSPAFEGTSKRGLYGDVIQEIDWSVGEILRTLSELKLLENTLVVFSSDNGPWLVMEDHGGSAGPLREGKQYVFEGGVRVPTVAMWKGGMPGGQVYEGMVSQMDWFPTFAALAGVEVPTDRPLDGEDISAVLRGEAQRVKNTHLFYNNEELRAYRKGDWKVKIPFPGTARTNWRQAVAAHDTLLFNLSSDPGETDNLFDSQPELARRMLQEMHAAKTELGPLPSSLVIRTPPDNSHYHYLKAKRENQ